VNHSKNKSGNYTDINEGKKKKRTGLSTHVRPGRKPSKGGTKRKHVDVQLAMASPPVGFG